MPKLDWRDVLRRIGRQTVQVVGPALAALAAGQHGISWDATGGLVLIAAVGALVTVLKAWAGLVSRPGDSWVVQASERVAAAVVAVLAGYTFAGPLTDLLQLPWSTIGWSCLGAAGIAVVALVTNPPVAVARPGTRLYDAARDAGAVGLTTVARAGALVVLVVLLVGLLLALASPGRPATGSLQWRDPCPSLLSSHAWTREAYASCRRAHWRGPLVFRVRAWGQA